MKMVLTLTLLEEILGTAPANKELYKKYINSQRPDSGEDESELDTLDVDEELKNQTTIFHRNKKGAPFIYDYQIKGFFKDACGMLRRVAKTESSKLKAFKKVIDGLIFITPREIPAIIPKGGKVTICERPLRAQTAQGERVALARSEALPKGTQFKIIIESLSKDLKRAIVEWLEYGSKRGLGQWRNSGKGRFAYTLSKVVD